MRSQEIRRERRRTPDGRVVLETTYARTAVETGISYTPDHVTYIAVGPSGKPGRQTVV